MISEIAIILICLCFLATNTRRIRRPVAFVAAVLVWGTARVLMEISFRGGSHEYSWGSAPSVAAACCLFMSVLLIYASCAVKGRTRESGVDADGDMAEADASNSVEAGASDRIRELLDGKVNPQ